VPAPAPSPAAPVEPAVQFPIAETPAPVEKPLPSVDQSDPAVREEFAALFGAEAVSRFLAPDMLIRRIVSTVDNLPREKLALRQWPVQPAPGKFAVTERGGRTVIAEENPARYRPFVAAVAAVDVQQAAAFYQRFYPLFQQAYRDLGYPTGYFNDRLVEVIDHLLATPDVAGPLELVRPAVYYKFADPALEGLSAGQKILLRIGADNSKLIKVRLAEFRGLIAAGR
jgi:hypothetical protein